MCRVVQGFGFALCGQLDGDAQRIPEIGLLPPAQLFGTEVARLFTCGKRAAKDLSR